jgi:hypothetical protein
MGRYSPTVLPEAYSPFAGFLSAGVSSYLSEKDRMAKQKLADAAEARAKEEHQQRKTAFEISMAQAGGAPTAQFNQTNRRAEVGRGVAAELGNTPIAPFAGPGDIAAGIAGATNRAWGNIQQGLPRTPALPAATAPAAPRQSLGTLLNDRGMGGSPLPTDRFEPRPLQFPRMGQQMLAQELGHSPNAPATVGDYVNYQDRDPGMRPYEAGGYTFDPELAYNRTTAAARMDRRELAQALSGVTLSNPAAQALLRAGQPALGIQLQQSAELSQRSADDREASRQLEGGRNTRAANLAMLQTALANSRLAVTLSGQAGINWRTTVNALVDLATEVSAQGTPETAAQRAQRHSLEATRDGLARAARIPVRQNE